MSWTRFLGMSPDGEIASPCLNFPLLTIRCQSHAPVSNHFGISPNVFPIFIGAVRISRESSTAA